MHFIARPLQPRQNEFPGTPPGNSQPFYRKAITTMKVLKKAALLFGFGLSLATSYSVFAGPTDQICLDLADTCAGTWGIPTCRVYYRYCGH